MSHSPLIHQDYLTDDELSIIVASLLGDGYLTPITSAGTSYFRVHHAPKQQNYMDWLYHQLQRIWTSSPRTYTEKNPYKRGEFRKKIVLQSHAMRSLGILREEFYSNRTEFPTKYLPYLTPLALACWFMDDGVLGRSSNTYYGVISSCALNDNSLSILVSFLQDQYNSRIHLTKQSNGTTVYSKIYIPGKDPFFSLIAPILQTVMPNKLPLYLRSEPVRAL